MGGSSRAIVRKRRPSAVARHHRPATGLGRSAVARRRGDIANRAPSPSARGVPIVPGTGLSAVARHATIRGSGNAERGASPIGLPPAMRRPSAAVRRRQRVANRAPSVVSSPPTDRAWHRPFGPVPGTGRDTASLATRSVPGTIAAFRSANHPPPSRRQHDRKGGAVDRQVAAVPLGGGPDERQAEPGALRAGAVRARARSGGRRASTSVGRDARPDIADGDHAPARHRGAGGDA